MVGACGVGSCRHAGGGGACNSSRTLRALYRRSSVMCVHSALMHVWLRRSSTAFSPSAVQSEIGHPCAAVEKGHPPSLTWRKYFLRISAVSYAYAGLACESDREVRGGEGNVQYHAFMGFHGRPWAFISCKRRATSFHPDVVWAY